ncbi:ECF RNA polymerase sigma-E factor [Symmachiella macrocystis]|uniref:ECF RNA polymerase sigma-E factor n=1 Tax=Symmachiella macrocystis TaxID=2527985 RepID=A0A5C6BBU8_9PLAN|nr:RNA polymerase sigma factor [Symmachiella macrocystis]TWU08756.1 ECF RNA polymerase sigma-E factor [Symmachiella macrocystis]
MSRNADDILNELLVIRAQHGDASALQLLIRRWHPKLIRHAHKLTEREDVAADVVQEGWVAIFRGLHRLKDPATFRGWAYRIVHHKSVDWIRSQTRERQLNHDLGQQITSPTVQKPPEELTDVEQLRNAIVRLTAEQQLLLRMFYDDEMPLKEIAAVLAVPEGTLKYRLFSLRQQLKKMIDRETS